MKYLSRRLDAIKKRKDKENSKRIKELEKKNKPRKIKDITDENSFVFNYPELLQEWNFKRNKINPETLSYGRDIQVWWKCSICKQQWKARLIDRTIQEKGCPNCNLYNSKGSKKIEKYLQLNNIYYHKEYKFSDCKDKSHLRFDFYIPAINLCIEYNGEQHYSPIKYYGGVQAFLDRQRKDSLKKTYCSNKNIKLLIISYLEYNRIVEILQDNIKL